MSPGACEAGAGAGFGLEVGLEDGFALGLLLGLELGLLLGAEDDDPEALGFGVDDEVDPACGSLPQVTSGAGL